MRRAVATSAFALPGDPDKMCRAMIDSIDRSPAPRRLTLGKGAYDRVRAALARRIEVLDAQKDIALSADFDCECGRVAVRTDCPSKAAIVSIRRVVPDVKSERFGESREFYVGLLGFEVAMETDWIVTFVSPANPTAQVSVMKRDARASVDPDVSIEVADVDRVYALALNRGENIAYPLTDEAWGVRRFFVRDPNGVVINVLSHVEK